MPDWQVIGPPTKWQGIETKPTKNDFQVATDLYYVDVNKR